jgi:transcriptional regulator with XRE-family HTH domain
MTGNELKALRAAYRLSQNQLARILGVTVVTIKRAERTKEKEFSSRVLNLLLDKAQREGRLKIPEGEPKGRQAHFTYPEGEFRVAEQPAQYGQDKKRQGKKPGKKS